MLRFVLPTMQRCALSVAANCCYSLSEDDFPLVADAISILIARLQHQVRPERLYVLNLFEQDHSMYRC